MGSCRDWTHPPEFLMTTPSMISPSLFPSPFSLQVLGFLFGFSLGRCPHPHPQPQSLLLLPTQSPHIGTSPYVTTTVTKEISHQKWPFCRNYGNSLHVPPISPFLPPFSIPFIQSCAICSSIHLQNNPWLSHLPLSPSLSSFTFYHPLSLYLYPSSRRFRP